MKKVSLFATLITLAIVLTACGSGSTSTNSFRSSNNSGSPRTLNPVSKLALGTLKLEGTKLAVDPKMAGNLVPLWQLMIQLNSSSSTAPQEVTAVMDQIQSTMSPDQINTINQMQISQADIFTVFQQQSQAGGSGGTNNRPTGSTGGGRRNGGGQTFVFIGGGGGPGGGPGGGFPGGGFGNNGGTGATTSTQASAAQAAQARENAISNLLINQVIRLLETKLRS